MPVCSAAAAFHQGQELIAHVDEGLPLAAAAQLEREDPGVEFQRRLDVADLERDVVEPN